MRNILTSLILASLILVPSSYLTSEPSRFEGKTVKIITFEGLENQNEESLLQVMRTTEGYPLSAQELQEDIKEVYLKGEFEEVQVMVDLLEDGVQLKFICRERPQIEKIEFKGNDEIFETDLSDAIELQAGSALRVDHIERAAVTIKAKYEEEGMFNAVINYRVDRNDEDKTAIVTFIIDEGEEIKVEKINILGAKAIYPKLLKKMMDTNEDTFFSDGAFKKDIYEQDKMKLVALYKQEGYLDAQILDDSVKYEWVDPKEKEERGIFITLRFLEGEKYYFDGYDVHIKTTREETVWNPEDFLGDFNLQVPEDSKPKEGQVVREKDAVVFNNTSFMQDRQMISAKYGTKGYIFARIIPKRTVTEREVLLEDGTKEKRKFVFIDFEVHEGSKAYVENIIIKGNEKTKDYVIRRELVIKEGELFDYSKMQLSREKVYNLGFFKEVNVDVRPGSREGFMNLIIDVEEQPTGTISLGGGYGTASGFSIFADVGENNLFGRGQRVNVKFEYGPLKSSATVNFYERWFMGKPVGFSASLFYYLYTIKTGSLFPEQDEYATYNKESVGYSLGFNYRFWYYYTVGTTWSHAFKHIIDPSGNSTDEVFINEERGWQEKRTITYYLYRDTKDNYLNPTKGSRQEMSISFTGGAILGGDDHFIKYNPAMYFYYSPFHLPFLKSHPVVFEFRANGTFLKQPWFKDAVNRKHPYDDNEWIETEDRLTIGGPETLRGWDYYDIEFPTSWRYVGLYHRILYGAEMRIPVHPTMFWLAFFFDAGSLWSDRGWEAQLSEDMRDVVQDDMEDEELYRIDQFFDVDLMRYFRYSYGFGFRVQIPMMPLRFWFGQKLIHDGSQFQKVGGLTFQFGIGDMRF